MTEPPRPTSNDDWLLLVGDVSERITDLIIRVTRRLRDRFLVDLWALGSGELWTVHDDPGQRCGGVRHRHLVDGFRALDVVTPEDRYPCERRRYPARVLHPRQILPAPVIALLA